ncbi:uncharacterized protein PG986_012429 [Apiospora aurea]|uniref:Uncharacterized protein n=1 Tax=Apiospora aurea TaxID=335848 RepID=A0ABR1PZY3_9PEZI
MSLRRERNLSQYRMWLASVVLCSLSALVSFCAHSLKATDIQCVRHQTSWSPATEAIEYHWETWEDFDFFTKSGYFQRKPSEEVDQAWDALLPKHPIGIPASKLAALGQSDSADDASWVRHPGDANQILALPEYAVQLGCLNLLRQWSFSPQRDAWAQNPKMDYSYLASFQGDEPIVWERMHQCLERIKQALMCWGDTGTIIWHYPTEPGERVHFDMGTLHKCRNFDMIQDWTKAHQIEAVTMDDLWWSGDKNV